MQQVRIDERYSWYELYRRAMLELDGEQLRERIRATQDEISQRLAVLEQEARERLEEEKAIADAVQNLRLLAQTQRSDEIA